MKVNERNVEFVSFLRLLGIIMLPRIITCEFSPGHVPDEFPNALINLSYIDPKMAQVKAEFGYVGKYGTGKLTDVTGVVIPISDNNSSNQVCAPSSLQYYTFLEPFVILLKDRKCGDFHMMICAAEANASGVIVYSDTFESRLYKKSHKVFQLPCIFISKQKGEELASYIRNGGHVKMQIQVERQNKFHYPNMNHTSLLVFSVAIVFSIFCTITILLFCYVKKYRFYLQKDKTPKRMISAARKAIERLPVRIVKDNGANLDSEHDCCAICIEPLRTEDIIRELPCKHTFHKACIDPWLLMRRSCPMCKLNILEHFGILYTGSQESILELDENTSVHRRHSSIISETIHVSRRNSSNPAIIPETLIRRSSPSCSFIPIPPSGDLGESSMIDINVLSMLNINNPGDCEKSCMDTMRSIIIESNDDDDDSIEATQHSSPSSREVEDVDIYLIHTCEKEIADEL